MLDLSLTFCLCVNVDIFILIDTLLNCALLSNFSSHLSNAAQRFLQHKSFRSNREKLLLLAFVDHSLAHNLPFFSCWFFGLSLLATL